MKNFEISSFVAHYVSLFVLCNQLRAFDRLSVWIQDKLASSNDENLFFFWEYQLKLLNGFLSKLSLLEILNDQLNREWFKESHTFNDQSTSLLIIADIVDHQVCKLRISLFNFHIVNKILELDHVLINCFLLLPSWKHQYCTPSKSSKRIFL